MVRSAFFYITRVLLFLPATIYGLVGIVREGHFEWLQFYPVGLAVLFAYFYFASRRGARGADSAARDRGLLIFALLQFHWLVLLLPLVTPAYIWIALACLAVLLGGVFAGTARPVPGAAGILIALGVLVFTFGGEYIAAPATFGALATFGEGDGVCFWSLFFGRNACSLAEVYPESLAASILIWLVVARQYLYEFLLALLLLLVAAVEWGLTQGLLVGAVSLAVLLVPGRERRTIRGWTLYIALWFGIFAGLTFSKHFAPGFYFYFQNNGAGNSWLFWVAGFFLAEMVAFVARLSRERGFFFTGKSSPNPG